MSLPVFAASSFHNNAEEGLLGFGLGYLTGIMLYHISACDATGGIESELEFPLNTVLFSLEGGYVSKNTKGQDAFKIGLQWSTNLGNGSGKLKDSDWLTDSIDIMEVGVAHPGLDIYSESKIALKANSIVESGI
jgi:hypothetical protein